MNVYINNITKAYFKFKVIYFGRNPKKYQVKMEVSSNYEEVAYNDKENCHALSNELLGILKSSTLPEQQFGFDKPLEVDMFKEYVKIVQSNLSKSISLLSSLKVFQDEILRKDIVINTVLLCGEHSRSSIWTSADSVHLSSLLLKELIHKCNCLNLPDLLVQFSCDSFLSKLRLKLDRNSWKKFPAAVYCFKWILTNIKVS